MAVRDEFIQVNGVTTKVMTFGGWIEDDIPGKHVVLCITGNPGITSYYTTFLATVQSKLNVPVWVVSHAGHELPQRSKETLSDNLEKYNLIGQMEHKIAFIRTYIPKDVKITFIGHSIGCKVILDVMHTTDIHEQVNNAYLLFPTVERMAVTPNGRFLTGTIKPFVGLIILASWFFHILPFFIKRFLIAAWLVLDGSDTVMAGVTVKLIIPKILRNVFYLAMDEMDNVTLLETEPIERFEEKLLFYYGCDDGWAPLEFCYRMREAFPDMKVLSCKRGFAHSFVLNSSTQMGAMVGDWIKEQ